MTISICVTANVPIKYITAQQERLTSIIVHEAEVASSTNVKILAFLYKQGSIVQGWHQRAAITLMGDQTTKLLEACKVVSATPTHVFHAAAALAVRDIQERPDKAETIHFTSYTLRNE